MFSRPNLPFPLNRFLFLQFSVIGILLLLYTGFGIYMNLVRHSNILFSHLAYIPIALAGIWWGKKSVLIAIFLSIVLFTFHIMGVATGESLLDLTRSLVFVTVALCIGILSDKTRKNKDALSTSEQRYRTLIEKSLTGIYVYRDEKVIFANARLCKMLEYTFQEIKGMDVWDLVFDSDRSKLRQIIENRKTGKLADAYYEIRLLNKNRQIVWADVSSSFTDFDGSPAIIVNLYNISEKKETERRQKELSELTHIQEEQLIHSTRLAELGEMAAGVAHELNQPLSGIRNFAKNTQYMLDHNLGSPDEIKENLRFISGQVDRAAKIISQMRELTRKSEKQLEPVDINTTLKESVEFLHSQLRLAGVTVIFDFHSDLPKVMGDRIRLSQVFLNIITNAKQAMEEEEKRELHLRTYYENGLIKISISDTGKGFRPEDREKIFRPFFTTKKAGQGTGLGLSISLSIINDHKGSIMADSIPGKRSIFRICLPKS